jgi:hypothetical protein
MNFADKARFRISANNLGKSVEEASEAFVGATL